MFRSAGVYCWSCLPCWSNDRVVFNPSLYNIHPPKHIQAHRHTNTQANMSRTVPSVSQVQSYPSQSAVIVSLWMSQSSKFSKFVCLSSSVSILPYYVTPPWLTQRLKHAYLKCLVHIGQPGKRLGQMWLKASKSAESCYAPTAWRPSAYTSLYIRILFTASKPVPLNTLNLENVLRT